MAVVNLYGSKVMTGIANTIPATKARVSQSGGKVRSAVDTVEVGAADSATSTYTMARIPSNAVILDQSELSWDDLASTGAPTLDIGLKAASGQSLTDDPDALNNGLDAATATRGARVLDNVDDAGKRAWEYIAGVTEDPGGWLDVYVTLADAAVNVGGTLSLSLQYAVD